MRKQRLDRGFRRLANSGFSLVELMITIVMGMIIIGVTYSTFISQQRSFVAQDQVAEMNTTSKIAVDMIANDIRDAGFGVPVGGTYNINGFTTVITATDSTSQSDRITLIGGFRKAGTLCSDDAGGDIDPYDTRLILAPPSGSAQLDNINTTDKKNISIGGLSFGIVIAGGGSSTTITLQNPVGLPYPKYRDLNGDGNCNDGEGVPVYVLEDYTYQVVGTDLQRVRRLNGGSPDTDVIAENIEDFQIAYGYDNNGNGVIDAVEWYNTPPAVDKRLLRIRINILARTAKPDPNFQGQGNPPARIENRSHAATNDSFRRRWWRMEVTTRNQL